MLRVLAAALAERVTNNEVHCVAMKKSSCRMLWYAAGTFKIKKAYGIFRISMAYHRSVRPAV